MAQAKKGAGGRINDKYIGSSISDDYALVVGHSSGPLGDGYFTKDPFPQVYLFYHRVPLVEVVE